MKRKRYKKNEKVENRKIDRFVLEVFKLCKRHRLCIVPLETKDELLIKDFTEKNLHPLRDAIDGTAEVIKENQTIEEKYKKILPIHQKPVFAKPVPPSAPEPSYGQPTDG
jgi:hypothetical protein